MLWLGLLCAVLAVTVLVLIIKLRLMQKAAEDIRSRFAEKLAEDTNTLIDISCGDRYMRRLAASINDELRLLRTQRRRYQQGDRELKSAVTSISHDLRTPLTAISGYLELLEREDLSSDAARYLELIQGRTEAMKGLTEELFRYSMVLSETEAMAPEPVCLNAALEESAAAFYGALTQRGIVPAIHMPDRRILRTLDRAALNRVLSNLLSNALKYSGGDLDITLTAQGQITFTNTAVGLTQVQVGRLFDRFFTVEAARDATGLGLSIAKALVERMGGTIAATLKDGRLSITVAFS